jgi:peptidoglycan/xylan/chitin deacetylase (PgdA/CDA1 family)
MTLYIAAYDTESPGCLAAARKIVEVHRRYQMPATFFIVGKTLEANPDEYRALLDDPLFEVASHTYSHRMLRDHPFCGAGVVEADLREEVLRGKEIIERIFERPCVGLRPGCSFVDGLKGAPEVLALAAEAGYGYVSSQLWGPEYTLPAPLNQAFTYADDGYPELWELPGHGWHENLLKGNNRWKPQRMLLWPPIMPEAIPTKHITTAAEEFDINRVFIDHAADDNLEFVSLIWHPWSLDRFDPDMRMLELTFEYVQQKGILTGTYADLLKVYSE